jgi:hypothetical protein
VNATICAELLDAAFVFGGEPDSTPQSLQLLMPAHPCPKACNVCPNYDPVAAYERPKTCFEIVMVTGAEQSTTHKRHNIMGKYTKVGTMQWGCPKFPAFPNGDACQKPEPGTELAELAADDTERPIYVRVESADSADPPYFFYLVQSSSWYIGSKPSVSTATKEGSVFWVVSQGDTKALCPDSDLSWATLKDGDYVDDYKITVALAAGAP